MGSVKGAVLLDVFNALQEYEEHETLPGGYEEYTEPCDFWGRLLRRVKPFGHLLSSAHTGRALLSCSIKPEEDVHWCLLAMLCIRRWCFPDADVPLCETGVDRLSKQRN